MLATYHGKGRGMSLNAISAYSGGRKPLSKISADDLKAAGWTESKGLAIYLAKESRFWTTTEWHHSGTYAAEVRFYDPEDLVELWDELLPIERLEHKASFRGWKEARKTRKETAAKKVAGTFIEWTGSRKRPKPVEREFTGTLIGNWIELDGGGRKSAKGKNIQYHEV